MQLKTSHFFSFSVCKVLFQVRRSGVYECLSQLSLLSETISGKGVGKEMFGGSLHMASRPHDLQDFMGPRGLKGQKSRSKAESRAGSAD